MRRRTTAITNILVLLILVSAPAAWDNKISGTVTDVKKGDTIKILHKGKTFIITLYGIICPEIMQPYGEQAKQFTSQAILNKAVTIDIHKRQSETEFIGNVILPDGTTLSQYLLKRGLGSWDQKSAPDDIELQSFQLLAKDMKVGIWTLSTSADRAQARDITPPARGSAKPEKVNIELPLNSSYPLIIILSCTLAVVLLAFLLLAFQYRKIRNNKRPHKLGSNQRPPKSDFVSPRGATEEQSKPDTEKAEEAIESSRQTIKSLLSNLSDFVSGLVEDNSSYNDKMKDHKTSIKQAMTKAGVEEIRRLLILEIEHIETNSNKFRSQLDKANITITEQKRIMEEIKLDAKLDFLTKLANRRAFDESLKEELERTKRYGGTFSIAMLDIDFFKNVNDKHGHVAGDKTLQLVAKLMKAQTRTNDCVGRFGGEEFAILLPQTPVDKALIVAEKIREQVQMNALIHEGDKINVTISAGVGEVTRPTETMEELIERVDAALYKAKESGRNQVKLATPNQPPSEQ